MKSKHGDKMETDELPTAEELFRRGWQQMLDGELLPISELWDGIDVDKE